MRAILRQYLVTPLIAANGGIVVGSGGFSIGSTNSANAALCVAQSSTGQVSGGFSYVVQ